MHVRDTAYRGAAAGWLSGTTSGQPVEEAYDSDGVHTFTADFFTEQWIARAELKSPEIRLSEHLNSSTKNLELWPQVVERGAGSDPVDMTGSFALINKARLLFVVPLVEPERPTGSSNIAWKRTTAHQCWVGIGPYTIVGKIHAEQGRHPIIGLRLLDKQFMPLTETTLTYPHGTKCEYDTIIVNRAYLDMLVLGHPRWGKHLPG